MIKCLIYYLYLLITINIIPVACARSFGEGSVKKGIAFYFVGWLVQIVIASMFVLLSGFMDWLKLGCL